MIKRTLCFSHPAYLSLCNGQLVVKLEKQDDEPERQPREKEVAPNAPGQQLELF